MTASREFMVVGVPWRHTGELIMDADGIRGPWPAEWRVDSVRAMAFGLSFTLERDISWWARIKRWLKI
jgi:hypothetical protein